MSVRHFVCQYFVCSTILSVLHFVCWTFCLSTFCLHTEQISPVRPTLAITQAVQSQTRPRCKLYATPRFVLENSNCLCWNVNSAFIFILIELVKNYEIMKPLPSLQYIHREPRLFTPDKCWWLEHAYLTWLDICLIKYILYNRLIIWFQFNDFVYRRVMVAPLFPLSP